MELCENKEIRACHRIGVKDPFEKITGKSVKLPPISPCIHRKLRIGRRKIVVLKNLFTRLPLIPYSERESERIQGIERTKPHTPYFSFNSDAVKDYEL